MRPGGRRRAGDELARGARVVREQGEADARAGDRLAHAAAEVRRRVAVGLGGENAEPAAADVGDRVLRAQRAAEGPRSVANGLRGVDLDGEEGQRPLVPGVAQHLVLEALGEQGAVADGAVHRFAFGPARAVPSGTVERWGARRGWSASTTSRSRWATSTRRSTSTAACSPSSSAGGDTGWRSSTWATSSSLLPRAARSRATRIATSGSSSTTSTRRGPRS